VANPIPPRAGLSCAVDILVLNQTEVGALLPMAECMDVMADALRALAAGDAAVPLRTVVRLPDGHSAFAMMPATLARSAALGVKVITVFPGNEGTRLDSHQGAVLLFEAEQGRLLAVMDASAITAIRTAAVSGVATRALAREDAAELAILGAGVQAATHLEAMLLARPVARVRVWSRTAGRAGEFARRAAERFAIEVEAVASAEAAVDGAAVVCTTTAAREPVLHGAWLAAGTHVNAVGASVPTARELDTEAVRRARLYVDRRESALAEAGDFLLPRREGAVSDDHIVGELGDVLLGRVPGRRSGTEVTLFKSLGLAVEDVAAARHVHAKAVGAGAGTRVAFGGERSAERVPLTRAPLTPDPDPRRPMPFRRLPTPAIAGVLGALLASASAGPAAAQAPAATQPTPFRVEETTIAELHAAMRAGTLTCRGLVERYLQRIAAYDKNGPAVNALVLVNPDALRTADSLDARARAGGALGALHCVPTIVKDNFETAGLQTTAGSLSMAGYVPARDATMVRRVRAAGAVVLAKSNMAEFAFTPYETVSSILPGYTKNPYALDRVTAGSSGGTAAAVAANLGEVGLGTDTGNSIRGPSSHLALVGIRSTMGLTSRAGVVPLNLAYDVAGPMARTVADAVAVFQVVAGYDPADSTTAPARTRPLPNYATALAPDGLRGARIGVLRQAYARPSADPEVLAVFDRAVSDLRRAGATVLDSVPIAGLDSLLRVETGECNRFKYDLERWIAGTGGRTPVHTLDEVVRSRRFHPSIEPRLTYAQHATVPPEANAACAAAERVRDGVRGAVRRAMDGLRLDALVYPTWSNPPRLIGDLNTPAGDNSQVFSPTTGWPAVQVPMGITRGSLPAGLTFFGRAWSEPTLFRLAYGYEQATRQRRPPATTPPLR